MKNILLVVHDDAGQEARFQSALDVVRATEGHLTCLDIAEYPALAGDDYGAGAILLADEKEREGVNRYRLEDRLARENIHWDWIDATGQFTTCIAEAAGLSDLIVVNRRLDSFPVPDMRAIAAETLVHSAKPLLAVPEASRGLKLYGHAMIAWDGSNEASAALREATSLLKFASNVTIVEIDNGSLAVPGEEAALYLSRHGIAATLLPRQPKGRCVADDLLRFVGSLRVDYLVMGAFGHSRLRETLFGGVTRSLLSDSPIPLFLAN